MPTPFTAKQGQYLAFIYYYSKIHGIPPAEEDFRRFFRVTPPVVHQMIRSMRTDSSTENRGRHAQCRLRLARAEFAGFGLTSTHQYVGGVWPLWNHSDG